MSANANAPNIAAVTQAVKEAAEAQLSSAGVAGLGLGKLYEGLPNSNNGAYPSPPSSFPTPGPLSSAASGIDIRKSGGVSLLTGSAIADGHAPEVSRAASAAARSRRASEGAGALGVVGKIGRMRSGSELKCEKCGKGYKHSSCLTKHLFVFPLPRPCLFSWGTRTAFLFAPTHTSDRCLGQLDHLTRLDDVFFFPLSLYTLPLAYAGFLELEVLCAAMA